MSPDKKKRADEKLHELAEQHAREHGLEYEVALVEVYADPDNIDLVIEYEKERRPMTPEQVNGLRRKLRRRHKRTKTFKEKEEKVLQRRKRRRRHPLQHPDPLGHRYGKYPKEIPTEEEIADGSWFKTLRRELALRWCDRIERLVNEQTNSESSKFRDLARALETNTDRASLWHLQEREARLWQLRLLTPGTPEGDLYEALVLAKNEQIPVLDETDQSSDIQMGLRTTGHLSLSHEIWSLLEQAVLLRLSLNPEDPPMYPWEPDVLSAAHGFGKSPLVRRDPMSIPSFYVRGIAAPWYWSEALTADMARQVQSAYRDELETFLEDALRRLQYEFASVRSIEIVYGKHIADLMEKLQRLASQPLRAPGGRGRSRTAILYQELAKAKIPEIRMVRDGLRSNPKSKRESWETCASRLNASLDLVKAVWRIRPKGNLGPFEVLREMYRLHASAASLQHHYHTHISE